MLRDPQNTPARSRDSARVPLSPFTHFVCRLDDITRDASRLEQTIRAFGAVSDRAELAQRGDTIPKIASTLIGSSLELGQHTYLLQEFIGSGASGFVFTASEDHGGRKVAMKIFVPFGSAEVNTGTDGRAADKPPPGSFHAEVLALRRANSKSVAHVQQLEFSLEVLLSEATQSTGIIISELVSGRPMNQIQDEVARGVRPRYLMSEAYIRMAETASQLADCGLAIDDLSPSHFIAIVNQQEALEQLRLIDLGACSFYSPEDRDYALKENLTALSYCLRDQGIASSPSAVRELAGDIEAGLEDLADGTITFAEFSEYLRGPKR